MDGTFKRLIPDLRGLIDPKAEQRLFLAFTQMYNYYDGIVRAQKSELESKIAAQAATIEKQSSLLNSFATPLIGIKNPTNPLASLGMGTVTTFSVTDTAIFTVTNAMTVPNLALNVQNANKGLFGPTSGGDAIPTFRKIVAADITGLTLDATILDWLAQ